MDAKGPRLVLLASSEEPLLTVQNRNCVSPTCAPLGCRSWSCHTGQSLVFAGTRRVKLVWDVGLATDTDSHRPKGGVLFCLELATIGGGSQCSSPNSRPHEEGIGLSSWRLPHMIFSFTDVPSPQSFCSASSHQNFSASKAIDRMGFPLSQALATGW